MLRTLIAAMIAGVVIGAAPAATGQTVHTYTGGGAYNYGLGLHGAGSGQSNHLAGGTRPGVGYAGAGRRFNGHAGSGWFNRGFGGTRNPGWDYGFGKDLGGSGR